MKVINPLKMNDWNIRSFSIFFFSVQCAFWGTLLLDFVGLHVPIIRQLISFIYLTFFPGILILRILRLHKLNNIETLLYVVGLSLFTLMFSGFLLNLIFDAFSIPAPISLLPLVLTINLVILVLFICCYFVDKEFSEPDYFEIRELLSPRVLFFAILPFLSILGVQFVNFYENNVLLLLMIIFIALSFVLICLDNSFNPKLYPFIIWTMAISLVWHNTLISSYILVNDDVIEYYYAALVVKNSFWDWTILSNYNAVLPTVILAPIYYNICNIDLTWIFKIIFPFLFSLTSIGVYSIFVHATKNAKIAFLSSFLYITIYPFIFQIPLITKQCTAELFLVTLFMLIFKDNVSNLKKAVLCIIFSLSLTISHYGTAYIVMFLFLFIAFLVFFIQLLDNKKLFKSFKGSIHSSSKRELININIQSNPISFNFILLFLVSTVAWYFFVSSSSSFSNLIYIFHRITNTIILDFMSSENSRGMYMIMRSEKSVLRTVTKFFYLFSQFFILIGFVKSFFKNSRMKFSSLYLAFSLYFLIILFLAVAVSYFSVMDPRRLFHLSLILLSPFCTIGGLEFCKLILKKLPKLSTFFDPKSLKASYSILTVFFTISFLLSSQLLYEVAGDDPGSVSISQESIKKYGSDVTKADFYSRYIMTQNIFSGKWLFNNTLGAQIYATDLVEGYPSLTIYSGFNLKDIHIFNPELKEIGQGYVQLSYLNLIERLGYSNFGPLYEKKVYNFSNVSRLLENDYIIYNNGGSKIVFLVPSGG
jgi:uncharacterized membrane protein